MDVATGFDALRDDHVRTGFFGKARSFKCADLMQNETSRLFHAGNDFRHHIPEEAECGHTKIEAAGDLSVKQSRLGSCRDQVDGEGPVGCRLQGRHFLGDEFGGLANHAEYAIPPRVGHRGRQFPARDATHPREQNGHIASKQVAKRCVQ